MLIKRKLKKLARNIKSQPDFAFIDQLVKKYSEAEVHLVGGLVRDYIIGRQEMVDYDFVIRNISAQKLREFLEPLGWVDLVGRDFGVYKFVPRDSQLTEAIDIALPRTDFATGGGGYHDFAIQTDPKLPLADDLSRRDFTINAMAVNMRDGRLVDPYGGLADIKRGLIRTVGEPKDRFREDYSRILRGIRFAAQLGLKIESGTWQSICRLAKYVTATKLTSAGKVLIVPKETLAEEFIKSLSADPLVTFDLYDASSIMHYVFPEIEDMKGVEQPLEFHAEGDVFFHTRLCLQLTPTDVSTELRLALLLHDIGKPSTQKTPERDRVDRIRFDEHPEEGAKLAHQICRRLRLANKLTERVVWLVRNHMMFVMGQVEDMRTTTIKKYFIDDVKLGDDLLELYRIDTEASDSSQQRKFLARQREVVEHIARMREAFAEAEVKTFRHIITGQDIMQEFNLEPGPGVGKYLMRVDDFIFKYVVKNKKEPSRDEVIKFLKNK
ncbi:HD domain-containing protein [Patescibacteria group bacterium]|nr:HD domain-containing protein [Patescibacteria group bacterium]